MASAPAPPPVTRGVLVTLVAGRAIGREEWELRGNSFRTRLSMLGKEAELSYDLAGREVILRAGEHTVRKAVEEGTIVIENGSWQVYALAAAQHPSAANTPVKVFLPAQDRTVPGTLTVVPRADGGGREVKLGIGPVVVEVTVGADGRVEHARVPLQGVEAWPEGSVPPPPQAAGPPEEAFAVTCGGVRLAGTLTLPPPRESRPPVVLIIAGSGPTDRNGNGTAGLHTDLYLQLAAALAEAGVASLRYDKRGVGESGKTFDVAAVVFNDFVADAACLARELRSSKRFGRLSVFGHSEGGLVALALASSGSRLDALVLAATPGRPLAVILREQISARLGPDLVPPLDRALAAVVAGTPPTDVPPALAPLFAPAVQAFLRSLHAVDPTALAHKARPAPTIVQGRTDLQVTAADAEALAAAAGPKARLVMLDETNHVFKHERNATFPQASYGDPARPLAHGFAEAVLRAIAR